MINYWAEDAIRKDPLFTHSGRLEIWEYLEALFGWRDDMEWVMDDALYRAYPDGCMPTGILGAQAAVLSAKEAATHIAGLSA